MFLADAAVGLIIAFELRRSTLPEGKPQPMRALAGERQAFWAMLMPIIIIGGMKSGIFTPTEAAVVATFYALVVALFIHREMKWSRFTSAAAAPPRRPAS